MEDWILDKRDFDELFYCIKDSNFPNSTKIFLLHKIVYATSFLELFASEKEFDKDTATKEDYDKLLKEFYDIPNTIMERVWQRVKPYAMVIEGEPDKTYIKEKYNND